MADLPNQLQKRHITEARKLLRMCDSTNTQSGILYCAMAQVHLRLAEMDPHGTTVEDAKAS